MPTWICEYALHGTQTVTIEAPTREAAQAILRSTYNGAPTLPEWYPEDSEVYRAGVGKVVRRDGCTPRDRCNGCNSRGKP